MKESRMADAYEGLAEKTELSYEEALALKEEIRKRTETPPAGDPHVIPARWNIATRLTNTEAVNFLNATPQTQPGEVSVTSRSDGKVDIYWWRPAYAI
jgi:hypothetical protein